jgi:hypothetical protein
MSKGIDRRRIGRRSGTGGDMGVAVGYCEIHLQSLPKLRGEFLVPVVQKGLGGEFPGRRRRVKGSGRRIRGGVEELYLIIGQGTT